MTESPTRPAEAAITACVIARDEAANLAELLPQLRWADEILVVVDRASSDETAQVAGQLADRVELREFRSFPSFRNRASALATHPWIFFVDADERLSEALALEVRDAISAATADDLAGGQPARIGSPPVAFWVPRLNIMFGRLIRGGGWSPDYQLRVFRRDRCRYDESRLVHETLEIDGDAGYLGEPLLHLSYTAMSEFFEKQRRYTAMEAAELRANGSRPRARALISAPVREFGRRYFGLGGWLDGPVGFFLCATLAYYAFQRARLARRSSL